MFFVGSAGADHVAQTTMRLVFGASALTVTVAMDLSAAKSCDHTSFAQDNGDGSRQEIL